MNDIEMNRRFPLRIVNVNSTSQQPVLLHYSFPPKNEEDEEPLLSISPNGTCASLVTKSTKDETEYCLSGTTTTSNNSDCILRVSGNNESFQLVPTYVVAGLKRDRKNDFFNVNDSMSKSARTTLKEKTRTISHSRRKASSSSKPSPAPGVTPEEEANYVEVEKGSKPPVVEI